ncbi:TMEM165/GDT1 family protein [Massilia sp. B-10]|nr:TMEM165/GDT1 family protein [Massilia sp. B-10]
MGDKTQVATVALAARFDGIVAVVAGTTLGMMLANVLRPSIWVSGSLKQGAAQARARHCRRDLRHARHCHAARQPRPPRLLTLCFTFGVRPQFCKNCRIEV